MTCGTYNFFDFASRYWPTADHWSLYLHFWPSCVYLPCSIWVSCRTHTCKVVGSIPAQFIFYFQLRLTFFLSPQDVVKIRFKRCPTTYRNLAERLFRIAIYDLRDLKLFRL